MADIALAIVAKLAEYLVDPLVRQGQYLFCASNITKTLETEKQKLASTQDGVQTCAQEALKKTEKVVDAVDKWLAEVKSHMDEVQKLEQQIMDSNSCFQGRCPTWRRYRLCRQMTKMIEATKNLNQRTEFNPFSILAPLPEIEYFSSRNFVYFKSTKVASDQLLAALQDDGVCMIGLYGMGGSGKTTLVTEVGKMAKKLNLFDRVIFTTVSQTLDIKNIQSEIADDLSLIMHEESDVGRAKRLSVRLGSGERILIILDDVWAKMNLKDVGIPFQDYHVGCKVLLTTRLRQVCNSMDCERKIHLDLLSDKESWTLFQKHTGNVDESLDNMAQEIVRECKGLPIAIQAVGASLKEKSTEEWKEALRRLRDSKPIDVEPGIRDAFSCLRLSYEYLRNDDDRLLFLMCSMYREDANIYVEHLFRIAIGVGMCEGLCSLEDARNKVSACINHLVDSCLLMRVENWKDNLRMHDTVRDVALWLSPKEKRTIVVNLEKDMKVATVRSIKDCYALTSWCNQTTQFPQRLDASKLEILLLTNIGECELSEANFRGMGALKVMQIDSGYSEIAKHLSLLPCSMNLLTNLRTLRLGRWQLGDDLSWVLGFKRLEVLDLKESSFKDLPQGLEELSELKLLDLSWIKEESLKIIERCTQLQELYAPKIQLSRATLKLGKSFSSDATFPRLKRYKLQIGDCDLYIYDDREDLMDLQTKALSLGKFNISALTPFIKYLLQQAEVICLRILEGGCKNILPDFVQVAGGMNELIKLRLFYCSNLECLADATMDHIDLFRGQASFFPKLIKLKLESLFKLKEIWRGPPSPGFFENLQELYISDCPMLTSLFPKCVARAVLLLQKVAIYRCRELKNIIEEDGDDVNNEIISASSNRYLVFSKLKSLNIYDCDKLQYVFSNPCVRGLEQLEEVYIGKASQLKYVFGKHEDEHEEVVQIKLPVLKSLTLRGLKNLIGIFLENFRSCCPSLREMHWRECPKLKTSCVNITLGSNIEMLQDNQLYSRAPAPLLFLNLVKLEFEGCSADDILFSLEKEVFSERNSQKKFISPLDTLKLKNLQQLKLVWSDQMGALSLQNLREFRVSGCNNLRTICSPEIFKSMTLLEVLEISDCNELKEIMCDTEVEEQHQGPLNAQSPQICFPNLKRLQVQRCNRLKCLFSVAIYWGDLPDNVLPNLRSLILEQVPNLKDFCPGLSLSNNCLPQLLGSKLQVLNLECLPEVWLIWRAPSHISKLTHLEALSLSECNKLKSVFGNEGIHGWNLPMLKHLGIRNCEELEEILTQDIEFQKCFPQLTNLEVQHCNKLKCVLSTSSVTILLPHLCEITISECEELKELFGGRSEASSNDNVKEIMLPNLGYITLTKLPSLVHICKGFKLSVGLRIRKIRMENCPKFSSIMGATGSVMELYITGPSEEPAANNGNQRLGQLSYLYPQSITLKLQFQELSELICILTTLTSCPNLSSQYLHDLTVHGCGKVKCILSLSLWGSLPQLEYLEITDCEELEEIMEESHQNLSNSFPTLRCIGVKGCPKLKCLFRTASVGMVLPKLSEIEVSEAAQMEELFSYTSDEVTDDANMQQIELPSLTTLELSKLPALTHFCKGCNLNAPELDDAQVQVNECPKFDFSIQQATSTQSTGMLNLEIKGDKSDDGEK